MLAERLKPSVAEALANCSRMRAAIMSAVGTPACTSSTANSSPPRRPTASISRIEELSAPTAACNARSPASCPLLSLIRQLWDEKGSARVDVMDPVALGSYGELCGWALACTHARSSDAIAIGSYLGSSDRFDRAMTAFVQRYADQNERDYQALKAAAQAGRVPVQAGL